MARQLGACRCPVCGNSDHRTHASESHKNMVCVTCMACRCQVFARSEAPGMSGEILRRGLVDGAPAIPPQPVAAAVEVKRAKPARVAPRAAPVVDDVATMPAAATAAPSVAKAMGWGLFKS